MTITQKLQALVSREGVRELFVHPKRSPYHSQVFTESDLTGAENQEFIAECTKVIDAAYVQKLERALLAMVPVVEASQMIVERFNDEPESASLLKKGITVGNHYVLNKALSALDLELKL